MARSKQSQILARLRGWTGARKARRPCTDIKVRKGLWGCKPGCYLAYNPIRRFTANGIEMPGELFHGRFRWLKDGRHLWLKHGEYEVRQCPSCPCIKIYRCCDPHNTGGKLVLVYQDLEGKMPPMGYLIISNTIMMTEEYLSE